MKIYLLKGDSSAAIQSLVNKLKFKLIQYCSHVCGNFLAGLEVSSKGNGLYLRIACRRNIGL
jgi:hypothetical protein